VPELPEVETIATDLNRKVKGEIIMGFWTDWLKAVKHSSASTLGKQIKGLKIVKVSRIGKNVIFHLSEGKMLLIHQKMTGHLLVGRWRVLGKGKNVRVEAITRGHLQEKVNQYIHAIFSLRSGKMIALSDMRKFARIAFGDKQDILELPDIAKLGPDALGRGLTLDKLKKTVGGRKRAIKAVLMDPSAIAGIGNIYADEILWKAKVNPLTPANRISEAKLKSILAHTKAVLQKAVKLRGTSVGDYRDASGKRGGYGKEVLIYRKTGEPCPRCGTPIERIKIGQRSAHFCPRCQKL